MKNVNLSTVSDGNRRLEPGGYALVIRNVEDHPLDPATGKGDYLSIEYDIDYGPLKGYYESMFNSLGFWGGRFIRSYKPKALGMFKGFIKELKIDNPNFEKRWKDDAENDEKMMIGCKFGAVLGEEEYRGNDGTIKKRLYVAKIIATEDAIGGHFTVPELKTLPDNKPVIGVVDTTEQIAEDMPI